LTVDYRELFGASGSIPNSYGRREGRLSDREILTCRLIDRSIRPLFPKNFRCETQIIGTVLSADAEVETDVLGLLGASAALHISDIPWNGPLSGMRIASVNGDLIINPNRSSRENAELDLVISSGSEGLIMVEGQAREIPEKEILEVLHTGQDEGTKILEKLNVWRNELGRKKRSFDENDSVSPDIDTVKSWGFDRIQVALDNRIKQDRNSALTQLREELVQHFCDDETECADDYTAAFTEIKYQEVRRRITEEGQRLDGRTLSQVRPISGTTNWVASPHGSALFTRGETQAFVTCSLGTNRDALKQETIHGSEEHHFFLHYNFPPYSVGEVRPVRGPGRREIGHGNLAWQALKPVIPNFDQFPYTIRVFSEITQSNGSSSMASVCGGTLALMDAGVPITSPVAGIAMGLVSRKETIAVLTDILGDEDHLGDMDFKVAGTVNGITAIQMDNKIGKLPAEVLKKALLQAREGLEHILNEMEGICSGYRTELKTHVPQTFTLVIRPEKVKVLIGPGGKTIKEIQGETGANIEVDNDGNVRIYSTDAEGGRAARDRVQSLTREAKAGSFYLGKVISIKSFGVFVEIFPGTEGLVHVSELDKGFVDDPSKVVHSGDQIPVKVLGVDARGKIKLSRKEALGVSQSLFEN